VLIPAHDLLVHLLACRTRRWYYNNGMSMHERIQEKARSPTLLVSVTNIRSKILTRMEYTFFHLTQGKTYDRRKRTETIVLAELHAYLESEHPPMNSLYPMEMKTLEHSRL
jgi:hypothetical protein